MFLEKTIVNVRPFKLAQNQSLKKIKNQYNHF